MAKSPEEMTESMIQNLKEKTGKSLDDWLRVVGTQAGKKHSELVRFLKTEHGLTHGYANLVVHKALASDAGSTADTDDLVEGQYAGAKAMLRPIYDALLTMIRKLGPDIEVAPKKAYVSVRRSKQFAILQPSTATRLDVGLNLKGVPPTPRLEASGSFNSMVSHRVRVTSLKDMDAELERWLREAYDAA